MIIIIKINVILIHSNVGRSVEHFCYDAVCTDPNGFFFLFLYDFLAAKDPVLIEKSNLVNISKLVVKELIETSQKYGRMLDSDHLPLQHFFIVLEHVLRHGLKPKKVGPVVCRSYFVLAILRLVGCMTKNFFFFFF